jgi:hypothetical protein
MNFDWYSSIAGIVAATIVLVEILKHFCGNLPWFGKVPTWLYAVGIAIALTMVAHMGLKTLAGNDLELLTQAVMLAAVASGFKEWISNGTKPLSASTAARTQRGELP